MQTPAESTAWSSLRRAIGALLAVITLVSPELAHAQAGAPREFTTRAKQAVLMDSETGNILFQVNADDPRPPASMTKLMTLAVLFKALKDGKFKPEDEFVMSLNAWRRGGAPSRTTSMFVPLNQKARISELIQGIVVQTANDASIAVAEGIAGNEDAFAKLMTEEAKLIGMKRSVFRNSTGFVHPEHVSTARDLAVLARHLIREYPAQFPVFSQREFNYRKHKFTSFNPLLNDAGIDGMMPGGTAGSYGLVVTSKQEGRRLIAVVHGASSEAERREEARKLLDHGFKNFSGFKLFDAGEVVGQARVWGGSAMYVPLSGDGEVTIQLPTRAANSQRLRAEIIYSAPLKPPIRKGDPVARLRVTSSSSAMSEVPLYATEDVASGSLVRRGLDSLTYMAFGWLQR